MASRRSVAVSSVTFGVTSGVSASDASVGPSTSRVVVPGSLSDTSRSTVVGPPTAAPCTPSPSVTLVEPRAVPPPDVENCGVVDRVGGEHDGAVSGVDDGAHLQVVGRHRVAVDDEPPGTVAVGDHHEALAEHGRGAGDQLDPRLVLGR